MNHDDSDSNPWGDSGTDWDQSGGADPSGDPASPGQRHSPPPPGHGQDQGYGHAHGGGQSYGHSQPHSPPQSESPSGLAIGALVAGILSFISGSLVLCCGVFGSLFSVPVALAAMVMAYMDWTKIQSGQSSQKGKPMVIIGGVLGALIMVLNIGMFGLFVVMLLVG